MKRLSTLVVVVALVLPSRAWAAPPSEVTPESTSAARLDVERSGATSIAAGDLQGAADSYWSKGIELRDPVLIVASAETLRDLAKRDRSVESAKLGLERLALAFDMLIYLRDSSTSTAWQPISADQVGGAISRAERCESEIEALIAEIEAEAAAAAATPEPQDEPKRKGKAKPGTGLIIGGGVALGVGLGMGGLGAFGLVIGASAQDAVEDPLVYEDEHRAAESRGRTGNILAGVGFGIGGLAIGAGAALIVIGLKKRKGGQKSAQARIVPTPMWLTQGAGLGFGGRF